MKYQLLTKEEVEILENQELDWEELKQFVVSKWFYDKDFFCQYFLNWYWYLIQWEQLPTPKHHKEIREYLDKKQNFNLIEPRWHWKTTAVLEWILWAICYEQEKYILYIATEDLWKQWLWKIRWELETNALLIACFWNLVPTNSDDIKDKRLKRRKQTNLEFLNWCSLSAMTKWQAVRWLRPTKIVFDDPQENKDVLNKRVVDKFNNWVFSSLYNTLLPWWSMTVLWTIVWNLCLVQHLKNEKKRDTIYREACDWDFNHVLWPELRNKESLIQRRDDIWTPLFNQEFRHIPLNREDALISLDWIQYRKTTIDYDRVIMAVDPIKKESEKSDFMWICVAWIKDDIVHVLFTKWIRLSEHKAERFIQLVYEKYRPDVILQEANIELTMIANLKKSWLPMKPITSTKDKYTRLLNVQPMFENWKVFFRDAEKDSDCIWQITNFPDVDHDDIMDALVFVLQSIKKKNKIKMSFI